MSPPSALPPFDEIVENFDLLDEWDDRYRYLIELGRMLPPLTAEAHNEDNKVQGCASQVWLDLHPQGSGPAARIAFDGDSDAHIVKGLVALLVSLLSGRTADEIRTADPLGAFDKLGLAQHLTPQRSNGLRSMVDRVRREAARVAAG